MNLRIRIGASHDEVIVNGVTIDRAKLTGKEKSFLRRKIVQHIKTENAQ